MRRFLLLPILALLLLLLPCVAATANPEGTPRRTRAEVEALIEKEGRSAPSWWNQTQLRYPRTLDLSWPPPPRARGTWDPNKHVPHYMWSVINENPSRWHEGVRFLHHLLSVNRSRPESLRRVMDGLGSAYHTLLRDWARAAFWWRRSGCGETALLAECYWHLGSPEMAAEVLQRIGADTTRSGQVIKLWSDMGDLPRALAVAQKRGGTVGMLAAGDACRLHGRYAEAVSYYDRVLRMRVRTKPEQFDQKRASASREAVLLFDALDLSRVRPGTYRGQSMGYGAPLFVDVVVQGGRIQSVVVVQHKEKQFYSSLTETPQRIIEKQGVKGVDATSGATVTSEAIINATAKALWKGMSGR